MTVKELWESGDIFKCKMFNEISNTTIVSNDNDNKQYLLNLDCWNIECSEDDFEYIEVVE